jgi:hypothetical protein
MWWRPDEHSKHDENRSDQVVAHQDDLGRTCSRRQKATIVTRVPELIIALQARLTSPTINDMSLISIPYRALLYYVGTFGNTFLMMTGHSGTESRT